MLPSSSLLSSRHLSLPSRLGESLSVLGSFARGPPTFRASSKKLQALGLRFVVCREYTFADAGNLEHCAKYLNQTLVTFGFPASLDLLANDPVRFQPAPMAFSAACLLDFFSWSVCCCDRFRLQELAIASTLCFSRGSAMLSSGNLLMSRGRGWLVLSFYNISFFSPFFFQFCHSTFIYKLSEFNPIHQL